MTGTTEVEHLVVEIKGKSLPFKEALGSDPYFRLINPKLLKKNKRRSDGHHIIYESEAVQNCHEPQWLAINFYSDKHDFDADLILQVYDNVNFYYPVYIGETSFKISDFRDQFCYKKVGLEITPEGLTGYQKGPTRPSHPYQGKPFLNLRRQLQTSHGSKTSNAPCFEEVMGDIFHKRSHETKTNAFWERTNARRAKEEEEFLIKLKEQFDHFDIDGNGTIDEYEMFTIIPEVWGGRTVTQEEVLEIITEVDADFNGVVDFEEFRQCVKVLDRRYAERIAQEKKEERMKRLEEREKTQWEKNNEQKKLDMIAQQNAYIKDMEDKALKKAELKKAEAEKAGIPYEEYVEVENDEAASSVYSIARSASEEVKNDEEKEIETTEDPENQEESSEQVESNEEVKVDDSEEKRPDMGGSLIDWVNEAKAKGENDTVEFVADESKMEAEIEAQATEEIKETDK